MANKKNLLWSESRSSRKCPQIENRTDGASSFFTSYTSKVEICCILASAPFPLQPYYSRGRNVKFYSTSHCIFRPNKSKFLKKWLHKLFDTSSNFTSDVDDQIPSFVQRISIVRRRYEHHRNANNVPWPPHVAIFSRKIYVNVLYFKIFWILDFRRDRSYWSKKL